VARANLSTIQEMIMTITTRLTKRFGIKHPIVLAPMTPASGGAHWHRLPLRLEGLGLLGGVYHG